MPRRNKRRDITLEFNVAGDLDREIQYQEFINALDASLKAHDMRIMRGTTPRKNPKWTNPTRTTVRLEGKQLMDMSILSAMYDTCHSVRQNAANGQALASEVSVKEDGIFRVTFKPSKEHALAL